MNILDKQPVVKSNALINARFNFSALEQKIITFALAKMQPEKDGGKNITIFL